MTSKGLNTLPIAETLVQTTSLHRSYLVKIYEYDIRSVRQLEYKKHEVETRVTKTKWVWE